MLSIRDKIIFYFILWLFFPSGAEKWIAYEREGRIGLITRNQIRHPANVKFRFPSLAIF